MWWRIIGILVFVLGFDRVTKLFFMVHTPNVQPMFPNVLDITRHRNFGIIANLPIPQIVILSSTLIALIILSWLLVRACRANAHQEGYALALLLGGALGNFWDRIQWGFVFDWILLFHISIINIADICIGIGLFWILRRKRFFLAAANMVDTISYLP